MRLPGQKDPDPGGDGTPFGVVLVGRHGHALADSEVAAGAPGSVTHDHQGAPEPSLRSREDPFHTGDDEETSGGFSAERTPPGSDRNPPEGQSHPPR